MQRTAHFGPTYHANRKVLTTQTGKSLPLETEISYRTQSLFLLYRMSPTLARPCVSNAVLGGYSHPRGWRSRRRSPPRGRRAANPAGPHRRRASGGSLEARFPRERSFTARSDPANRPRQYFVSVYRCRTYDNLILASEIGSPRSYSEDWRPAFWGPDVGQRVLIGS